MVLLPPVGISAPLHPWIAWNLWKARNALIFDNRRFTEAEVLTKTLSEARAWQDAQVKQQQQPRPRPDAASSSCTFSDYSVFVDAALQALTDRCGVGWCFLDPQGSEIANGSATHLHIPSALLGEAIALKTALEAAQRFEFHHFNVYSDSQTLVSLLNSDGDINELKSVLYDIRRLIETFSSLSIFYVPRSANVRADSLAKKALYSV